MAVGRRLHIIRLGRTTLSVVSSRLDDVTELWIGQGVHVLGQVNPEAEKPSTAAAVK
jgi:hypothetical protein